MKLLAGTGSLLFGLPHLSGCLGESGDSSQSATSTPPPESSSTSPAPAQPTPAAPATTGNSGPVWQPSPTIEFVEGVPASVSIRAFVQDPDRDPLVIKLRSGKLLPGITWNPNTAVIAYDGRPLAARPGESVVLTGITFSADDGKKD